MLTPELRFETVTGISASLSTLQAIAWHQECIRAERIPEDPPFSQDGQVATLRLQKSYLDECCFLVWANQDVVGLATLTLPLDQNTHLAFVYVSVLPSYRRQGLGRHLMAEILTYAQARNRRVLLTNASSRLPAGELVLRHVGAQLVMEQQFMQLNLSELEPDLPTRWIAEVEEKATAY